MPNSNRGAVAHETHGPPELHSPLWKRLAWMAGIWLASVTALGLVAMIIKFWLAQ